MNRTPLENFLEKTAKEISLASEFMEGPPSPIGKLVRIAYELKNGLEQFAPMATVVAPSGTKWPLGVCAQGYLREADKIAEE